MVLRKHEQSSSHHQAVEATITLPPTTVDIGEQLSKEHTKNKEFNRSMLLKIFSGIRYLARQGLALRGDGNEGDGNFLQILKLKGEDDPRIHDWLKKKMNKYTSPEIQNTILRVMAMRILRDITTCLQSSPFITVMMDETTDVTNKEQATIVFRSVSHDFEVNEEFLGLYEVPAIDASTLKGVMMDALCRMNIPISKVRGQCYDGASTMQGARSGVAKRIMDEEPRALYTHCYGHSINLAVNDAIKRSKPMKNALETTHEISKLIKFSPRREGIFQGLKSSHDLNNDLHSPGMRLLCPTRWTVRADSLASIINNYEVLMDTWEEAIYIVRDTETKARINGVSAQMKTFDFAFGTHLGEMILRHADNLSRTIQAKSTSAAEGQGVAKVVISTIKSLREEGMYDLFWLKVVKFAESLDIQDPQLPRRRKRPARFDDGDHNSHYHHETPKEYYRQLYYEAIDNTTRCLVDRFDQPGYKKYCQLEQLLIKGRLRRRISKCMQFLQR